MAAAGAENSAGGSGPCTGCDDNGSSGTGTTSAASSDSDTRPLVPGPMPRPRPGDVAASTGDRNGGTESPHNAKGAEEENMEVSPEAADSDDESSQVTDLSMGLIEDFEGQGSEGEDEENDRDEIIHALWQSLRLGMTQLSALSVVNSCQL